VLCHHIADLNTGLHFQKILLLLNCYSHILDAARLQNPSAGRLLKIIKYISSSGKITQVNNAKKKEKKEEANNLTNETNHETIFQPKIREAQK
jgi:hypothetical protein